jgi:arsenate reductase-like glutaredoxin family protein
MDITIYHNPACGTSRNVLAMIRNTGIEPHVVEYLRDPTVPRHAGRAHRTRRHHTARPAA